MRHPQHHALWGVAASVLIVAGSVANQEAAAEDKARRGLPPAVARAIDDNRPGAEIDKLDVEKEHGFTFYDIEFKAGQGEMDVAEDGTVLNIATIVELKDVPEPAAAVIQEAARGTTIKQLERSEVRARIEKAGSQGKLVRLSPPEYEFEAELRKGGEIEVAADGRVIKGPSSLRKRAEGK